MTRNANAHRRDEQIEIGDKVYLSTKNLDLKRPMKKLGPKWIGSFGVVKKHGISCELKLPATMEIHPTFHPSLLSKSADDPLPGQGSPKPDPVSIDGEDEWTVEEIVDSRPRGKGLQYRVRWEGYHDDLTWYPSHNFSNSQEMVDEYHRKHPDRPKSLKQQRAAGTGRPKRGR